MQPTNLPELEQIISTLVADARCACHIINPHKTRILMWKETKLPEVQTKDNQTTYYLKIGIQKFTSQPQKDRNGETYWRYWTSEPKKEEAVKNNQSSTAEEIHATNSEHPVNEQSN